MYKTDEMEHFDDEVQDAIWEIESGEDFVSNLAYEWHESFGDNEQHKELLEAQADLNKALDYLRSVKEHTEGLLK